MKFSTIVLALFTFFFDLAVLGYLLESENMMKTMIIASVSMLSVALIISLRQTRKKGYRLGLNPHVLWNFLVSIRKYMKVNYQTIAIASIGIILGTIAFSQAIVVAQVSTERFIEGQVNVETTPIITMEFSLPLNVFFNGSSNLLSTIQSYVSNEINNGGFTTTKSTLIATLMGMDTYYYSTDGTTIHYSTLTFYSPELIADGNLAAGKEPTNGSEFLVIYSSSLNHVRSANGFINLRTENNIPAAGRISGYFDITNTYLPMYDGLGMPLTYKQGFYSFYQNHKVIADDRVNVVMSFYVKYNNILADSTQASRQIQGIVDSINDYIITNYSLSLEYYMINSPLLLILQNQSNLVQTFKFILLSLSLPIIVLASFIISFTSNLLELKRKRILFMLKQRGASELQILGSNLSELVIISLFSGIIGGLLAVPVGYFFASTTDLLTFSFTFIKSPRFSLDILLNSIAIAFALTITFNLNSAIHLSQITYFEAANPEKTKKGLIARYNLDMLSLVIGIIFSFLIYTLQGTEFFLFLSFFLILLVPVAFFGLTVGSVMVFTRSFEGVIIRISKILWKRTGRLPAFGLRNLALRKQLTTKIIGLFMIGFIFFMFFTTLPTTLKNYEQDTQLYNNFGTNLVVSHLTYNESISVVMKLKGNPNISSTSVAMYDVIGLSNVTIRSDQEQLYYLLAIDPNTYFNTAYFYPDYVEPNPFFRLFTNVKKIGDKLQEQGSVLALTNDNLDENTELTIPITQLIKTYYLPNINEPVHLTVKGKFLYWPGLIDYNAYYYTNDFSYHLVTSINTIKTQMSYALNFTRWQVLIRVPDNNLAKAKSVEQLLDNEFQNNNFEFSYWTNNELTVDPEALVIFSVINANILFGIITGILGILIFNYVTLTERKKELSLLKSLGMVRKQIITMLLVEILFLAVIGVIMGLIMGWLSSVMFIGVFYGFSSNIPPIRIIFTKNYNTIFSVGTVLLSVLSSIAPALKISHEKPGTLLRVE